MKYLMLGDVHGMPQFVRNAASAAFLNGARKVIQLGDFGIGDWGLPGNGEAYLDEIEDIAYEEDVEIYFIDGNHEDFDEIDRWKKEIAPNHNGHLKIREDVFYIPRGSFWNWNGRNWLAMGGAYSIDKHHRTPGKSWWPQERPTWAEITDAIDAVGDNTVDVLLTHDAMEETQWPFLLQPIMESQMVRQDISGLTRAVRPATMFHGHYHCNVNWKHPEYGTRVHGLTCDGLPGSMGVLDDETLTYSPI